MAFNNNIFLQNNNINQLSYSINRKINPQYLKNKFFHINLKDNFNQNYNYNNEKKIILKERNYSNNSLNFRDKIINQNPNKYTRNSLDVKDINYFKNNKLFTRQVNPLDPKYNYDWQMTEINENRKIKSIDFDEIGNHPKPLYLFNNEKNGKNLNTNDIIGAQPGTKSHISKLERKYGRQMKHINEDIIGSHPGSLKRGIETNRNTNPLNPDYPLIGGNILEYGNEKDNKYIYDYKSLLDYYNKHSKITNPYNNENNKNNNNFVKKIDNYKLNNFENKNLFDNLGKERKIYPREQYRKLEEENHHEPKRKQKDNLYFPLLNDNSLNPSFPNNEKNENTFKNKKNSNKNKIYDEDNNKMYNKEINQYNNKFPLLK